MTGRTEEDSFYNDLDLSFDKAWKLIEPGANNRTSSAHTPVVGTVDNEGFPQLRVMVLREADRNKRLLRFHTDVRSQKVEEIAANNLASVLMYDAAQKLQLRLLGIARISDVPADTENAWTTSTTFARRCYLAESAPGSESSLPTSGLPEWIEGKQPVEEQLVAARENFAVLWFEIATIELLYLANSGHRRARWEWQNSTNAWSGRWLVP